MNNLETFVKHGKARQEPAHLGMRDLGTAVVELMFADAIPAIKTLAERHKGQAVLYIGGKHDRIAQVLVEAGHALETIDPASADGHQAIDRETGPSAARYGLILLPSFSYGLWLAQSHCPVQALVERLAPGGEFVFDRRNCDGGNGDQLIEGDCEVQVDGAPVNTHVRLALSQENASLLVAASFVKAGAMRTEELNVDWAGPRGLEAALSEAGLIAVDRAKVGTAGRDLQLVTCKRRVASPLCHPFGDLTLSGDSEKVLMLTAGRGCKVQDKKGKTYIDACGGLWNTHIGLGNEDVIDAITEQLKRLSYSTLFANRGNEPSAELAKELISLAPYPMQWVCYTGSGSESTDLSIRLALLYGVLCGRKDRKTIAYLDESYHGTFGTSASVSGLMPLKDLYQSNISGAAIPTPNRAKCPKGKSYIEFALECADALEHLAKEKGVAAFIVEPMLGSAGVIVPPVEYFKRIRQICDQYDILLIVDEVATGFGRTGRWFACEHYGLEPDILLLAKGINSGYLPLGAVLFSAAIGEKFIKYKLPLLHGSTYNGHPVCCASALANLKVLKEENLIERSHRMGEYFKGALESVRSLACVTDVRGVGLMLAVGIAQEDGSPATGMQLQLVMKRLEEAGVLVYPSLSSITLCPALVISKEEIDTVVNTIYGVLSAIRLRAGEVVSQPESAEEVVPAA
jgi:adenosylmethionine-8-amino-7-oxononanoate aminotransferase